MKAIIIFKHYFIATNVRKIKIIYRDFRFQILKDKLFFNVGKSIVIHTGILA